MTLYVITESFFGNTRRIGEVIATELDVVLYGAASAPTDFADGDAVVATVAVSARRPLTPLCLVVRGLVLLRSDQ